MRTKIAAVMTAFALVLFPLGAFIMVHQGFNKSAAPSGAAVFA